VVRALSFQGRPPIRRRIVAIRRHDAPPPTGVVAGFWAVLDTIDGLLPDR